MDNKIDMLNEYFSSIDNFILNKKFEEIGNTYRGEFTIKTKKFPLYFVAIIPLIYPFDEIKFYTKTVKGYPHQIYLDEILGGAICLNTPFINDFFNRIILDVEKLCGWVTKYFENEEEDEYYEYPIYKKISQCELIFEESPADLNDERFTEVKFGIFDLSVLNNEDDPLYMALIAHDLGNKVSKWSFSYATANKNCHGFWVYIDREPVKEKKNKITDFSELIELFPKNFNTYLFNHITERKFRVKELKNSKILSYLAVGYKIPTQDGSEEIHWDLVLLTTKYYAKSKIHWAVSKNASYERFFGRGRLCDSIVNSNILVLGLGAVGSSLCEILARGGIKNLHIVDIDYVDIGNICRSIYSFKDNGYEKTIRLARKLHLISPYINILGGTESLISCMENSKMFSDVQGAIDKFDLIFDCTANNQISELLKLLSVKNRIIHLSITDKSKHMLCISNDNSVDFSERRNHILTLLKEKNEPTFREGTGCYYPTFQASFFDINSLLNLCVREVNNMIKKNKFRSFTASYKEDGISLNKDVIFTQKQLNLSLIITTDCLQKIKELSYDNYPNEFGGYLLGYYSNNGKIVFVVDIIVPTKYINSKVSFQPDKNSMNQELLKIHEDFEGKIRYLGEWHTHPNMSKEYSTIDYYSMMQIANSNEVAINNPLMLIVSFGKKYFNPTFYVYFQEYLYEFDKE